MSQPRALIVDDEPDIRELLGMTLGRMDIDVTHAADVAEARKALAAEDFAFCLTDLRLPDGSGLDIIDSLHADGSETPVAVITAYGDMDTAVQALKLGAFDFVSKPLDLGQLRRLVATALRLAQTPPASAQSNDQQLLGDSAAMRKLKGMIGKLARSQAPVHIHGESGTGKELVARMIHLQGPRADGPFIPVNCGAIPSELMESEFFGHAKGSFTGATANKKGLFEAADGGTLFLDEVADLPMHMQVKLLRAIQEKAVRPVGSNTEVQVDVRLLSATHKNLAELTAAGRFREDLYYRINVIQLEVPSLRERAEDLPVLIERIMDRLASPGRQARLSETALAALTAHPFPGNVRELENILERALTLCEHGCIEVADLGLGGGGPAATGSDPGRLPDGVDLETYLAGIERHIIAEALTRSGNNKTAAAKQLGISFRALRYRLEKLGLD